MTAVLECLMYFNLLISRFLEAAESGDIGKNGIFTIEEASTKLGTLSKTIVSKEYFYYMHELHTHLFFYYRH